MPDSNLMGFVRKSQAGGAIKVSINKEAFDNAVTHKNAAKEDYVGLIINMQGVKDVIDGKKDVTAIVQLVDAATPEPEAAAPEEEEKTE